MYMLYESEVSTLYFDNRVRAAIFFFQIISEIQHIHTTKDRRCRVSRHETDSQPILITLTGWTEFFCSSSREEKKVTMAT